MSNKKYVNIRYEEKTQWSWPIYGRIAVKKPLLREQTNIKRLQWVKVHKDWTIEQWNKVLSSDQSSKSFFQMRGSICGEELTKELQPPVSHQPWRMVEVLLWCVGLCQLQSRGFAPGEEKIKADWLSQHTAASRDPIWNAACGSRICIHAR